MGRDLDGGDRERLEVRIYRLDPVLLSKDPRERLNAGKAPAGAAGIRTQRWLNRRRFLLFAGWYLCAVVPALLLTAFAARLH